MLDYIFYNRDELKLLELLEVPEESELNEMGGLPSLRYASDHLRIEAKFLLKK